jgi:hypothetical protein
MSQMNRQTCLLLFFSKKGCVSEDT